MPLFKRFLDLHARLMSQDGAEQSYNALMNAYTAPSRAYHNARHIDDCLEQFDAVRDLFVHANKAELAIWFHDAVYDPHLKDNESRSAQWAADVLLAGGASPDSIALVEEFILATRHREIPTSPDARLIADIDLSILGRDEATFAAYDAAIRAEYAWVPEKDYRAGRAAVLRGFLQRERVYFTDYFSTKYEAQARANLDRLVVKLSH